MKARLGLALLAVLLLAGGAACRKVQANTPASRPSPPLEPPEPPTRVVVPVTAEPPDEPPPPEPERPAPPARRATRPPPEPTGPPPVLRPADVAALERQTRTLMDRANTDLAKVNRTALGREGRDQFDTAKRFLHLADQALTIGNVVYARQLADNAAALAAQLVRAPTATSP